MAINGWDIIHVLLTMGLETLLQAETFKMIKRNNT